jgi:dTMP kinase
MQTQKGKFFVVDGIRGVGKSTLIENLKVEFPDMVFSREPGGTNLAEDIRLLMRSENARSANGATHFLMAWASRADHLKDLIIPTLEKGNHFLSDRFDISTFGINLYAQDACHLEDLFFQTRELVLGEYKPDLYIYLDAPLDVAEARYKARPGNTSHFHDQPREYYERMREGYIKFLQQVPHSIIDANRPKEEITIQCAEEIRRHTK